MTLKESEHEDSGNSPAPEQRQPELRPTQVSLPRFIHERSEDEIKDRWRQEASDLIQAESALAEYCVLGLYEPFGGIGPWHADQIYKALQDQNSQCTRDVLLVLVSTGGSIEPAYQISKLCLSFAKKKFIAAVPRRAKSAATLIALGAHEIHIGPLGELGPIDPQLGGLPALGVSQALATIASVSERYPGSADMFSKYLRSVLTVEQIGYCERIGESAVQYAERLLSTKEAVKQRAGAIARELVYEYKDHSFVIDQDEAKGHLGKEWIVTESNELRFAEILYQQLELYNLFLGFLKDKRFSLVGTIESGSWIFDNERRR